MDSRVTEFKAALREKVRLGLAKISEQSRVEASAQAVELLQKSTSWLEARALLLYAPLRDELDVWPLLEQALHEGKVVTLPRFDSATNRYVACQVTHPQADVRAGRYGIREPCGHCPQVQLNRLDFALVPGVAFDLHGRRLGRGKGYFDRLLPEMLGLKCGVAFDEQIVGEIPVDPHDSDVNCILTPTRWMKL